MHFNPAQLAVGVLLGIGVSRAAYREKILTIGGAVAASVVGAVTFGLGGLFWALPLVTFFATSSLLSRWRRQAKQSLGFEKGARRDAGQVWANGGVATLCLLLGVLHLISWSHAYWLFLAALAAANADTWATEIGAGTGGHVYQITTGECSPPGVSGGISVIGTAAALAGAAVIALFGSAYGVYVVLTINLAGWLGSLFDSVLGATVQAQWRDAENPTRWTEIPQGDTAPARGFRHINNDLVNTACTLFAVIVTLLLLY